MTAEELLKDIDECCGPCGEMCLSCPESRYLQEIKDVIEGLLEENRKLKLEISQKQTDSFL